MKKIGIINENVARGGVDTFLVTLLTNWPDQTDEFVFIINDNHPGLPELKMKLPAKVKVVEYHGLFTWNVFKSSSIPLMFRKVLSLSFQYILFLLHYFKIKAIVKDEKIDIIFVVNGGYPGGDLCRAASLISEKPVIHNFHNMVSPMPALKKPFEWIINRLVRNNVKVFVSVSKACSQTVANCLNVEVKTIYNGLEIKKILPSFSHGNRFTCGVVGVLEPRKGHLFLFEAFKDVVQANAEAKLLVYGNGEKKFEHELSNYVKNNKLTKNIIFKGFVSDKEKIYEDIDVLVVPSLAYESFGLICVEAMMREIPVICTNVGGLPEVVSDKSNGFVVDKNNVKSMSEKILLLLKDQNLRTAMGKQGRKDSEERFTATRMAADYHALIHSIKDSHETH